MAFAAEVESSRVLGGLRSIPNSTPNSTGSGHLLAHRSRSFPISRTQLSPDSATATVGLTCLTLVMVGSLAMGFQDLGREWQHERDGRTTAAGLATGALVVAQPHGSAACQVRQLH